MVKLFVQITNELDIVGHPGEENLLVDGGLPVRAAEHRLAIKQHLLCLCSFQSLVSFFLLPKTSWPHRQLSQAREEQDGEGGGQVRQVLVEEPFQLGFVFLALQHLHNT